MIAFVWSTNYTEHIAVLSEGVLCACFMYIRKVPRDTGMFIPNEGVVFKKKNDNQNKTKRIRRL